MEIGGRKSGGVYRLLFLSYLAILLLTISSLFVYYAIINRQVVKETEQTKLALLDRLCESMESRLSYADMLYDDFLAADRITLLAKGYSSYSYSDLQRDLQQKYIPDTLLNFTICFSGRGDSVTRGVRMETEKYFTYMLKPEGVSFGEFEREYLGGYHFKTVMPPIAVNLYGKPYQDVLVYLRSFPPNGEKPMLGQFLFFIRTDDLREQMAELGRSASSGVYIFDESGELMLRSESAPGDPRALSDALGGEGDGHEAVIGGKRYILTEKVSDATGWRYVAATSKGVYLLENARFAVTMAAIFLIYLSAGLLVVRLLTRRSYRPIRELKELIDGHRPPGTAAGSDEFGEIRHTLLDQFSNGSRLNEVIRRQMPFVRRDYLLSLLKGLETRYDQAAEKLSALGIPMPEDGFLIAAVEYDADSPFFMENDPVPEERYPTARVLSEEIGEGRFPGDWGRFFLSLDRNHAVFLFHADGERLSAGGPRTLADAMDAVAAELSDTYGIDVYTGVGAVHRRLESLPKCLDEAWKAMELGRERQSSETVVFGQEGSLRPDCYFPTETEYQLVRCLRAADMRQCREMLDHIFAMNGFSEENAGRRAEPALLYGLASAFARAAHADPSGQGGEAATPERILRELGEGTLGGARAFFMRYADRLPGPPRAAGKAERLVDSIYAFIEENAGDSRLDLGCLSAKFGRTPQYISNVFKKYRGISVKDCISTIRMDRARELLISTELSIHDIAVRIGYENELGVFRLFKKYEGVTPGEYRSRHRAQGGLDGASAPAGPGLSAK